MAINDWWKNNPAERYWMEITDRENLGANLIAPQLAKSGKETYSYTLVSHVQSGDVVFHWWNKAGRPAAIVAYSRVSGDSFESEITWESHGLHSSGPRTSSAHETPLTDFTTLEKEITLKDLRAQEKKLRALHDILKSKVDGPIYFPFAFSDKRPLRTAQGYLVKMPASVVSLLTGLTIAKQPLAVGRAKKRLKGTGGRQQDPAVRHAIERHAVNWAMRYYKKQGFKVQDVGDDESYDVLALGPNDGILHIKVKGSSTTSIAVELTDGEVDHWGIEYERILVVVDQIKWSKRQNHIATRGGRMRVWRRWKIDRTNKSLVPIRFRYFVPDGWEEI